MTYDLVIKNGTIISADEIAPADLAVRGERIAAVGRNLTGARELDATGLYVIPGAIDGHVHLTDPTMPPYALPTADSFSTASVAAAFGGTTALIDFAQPAPGDSLLDELDRRQEDADGHTVVDYGLHLNLRDPDPERLVEMRAVFERGVASIKLFMNYDGYRLPDDAIFRAMEAAARHNALAIVHAENYHIIRALRQRLEAAGRTGPRWHMATSPSGMEGEAVHRALALAELAGARVLIFHVSCREGVREITAAKDRGLPAYGETCPQYLVLTEAEYRSDDLRAESLMVIPPIRDESHQAALWRGLGDGRLDIVSTDHNPRRRLGDPPTHPAGTSGIETRVALLHTFGVRTGKLSLNRWVDVCSTRPAQVFGMRNKGRLLPGYDADIVLFDPEKEVTFSTETLHSPIDFCTYDGLRVRGFPVTTISRGDVIVENGAFVGAPGRGRFVPRSYD